MIKEKSSTKINNFCKSKLSRKYKKLINRENSGSSSVNIDNLKKNYDTTSIVIRESKYSHGWDDKVKILSKQEFINILKKNKNGN
jgi:hypothetical protein